LVWISGSWRDGVAKAFEHQFALVVAAGTENA
jgi:hypothetical protein